MQFTLHPDALHKLRLDINDICERLQDCVTVQGNKISDGKKMHERLDKIFTDILNHPAVQLLHTWNKSKRDTSDRESAAQRQELESTRQDFHQIVSDVHKTFGHGQDLHSWTNEQYQSALA